MLAECPVCRQPLRWTYLLRHMWSQWRCTRCNSLLAIDRKRRVLSILPLLLLGVPLAIFLTRSGWNDLIAAPTMLIVWLPFFLLLDRATVLERGGFRCQQCGYDLRGQALPRCPECGRQFDEAEQRFLATGIPPPLSPARRRNAWIGAALILLLAAFMAAAFGLKR